MTMTVNAELVQELKTLRKGRGVAAVHIEQRIGPALRAVCDVGDGDGGAVTRRKVAGRLAELAEQLPADLRLAVLAAFGVTAEARLPLYQDRVRWAAARVERDARTVRRRVDEAINILADLAGGLPRSPAPGAPTSWHTTQLRVSVALDQPQPEVFEQRMVVADQDDVRELELAISLPVARRELDVDLFYGGSLRDRGREATDRFGFTLMLPKPLARGEPHEFAMRFRLPDAEALRPYFVCVPRRLCELFDLRVRFDRDRVPPRVWLLDGAFQRDVADPVHSCPRQEVDDAGEIHLRFHQLAPGLAFGARWDADNRFRQRLAE
jgi:hypothetical protein